MELEAAHWVATFMNDEPVDQQCFERWLRGDPRRRELFDRMWQRIMGPNMETVLHAYRRKRETKRKRMAAACAGILVLFAGYGAPPTTMTFFCAPPRIWESSRSRAAR
ncbi:hypothetical protein C725_2106 [Pacificimonas flava]|uniref:Uncharacterized protein n=2 Tax=Pacificimonas flava TaxID=1234595 RepID=M2SAK7_9SPHN|nr:hypothetical protein C725_2106 [Pacificimonas flava]